MEDVENATTAPVSGDSNDCNGRQESSLLSQASSEDLGPSHGTLQESKKEGESGGQQTPLQPTDSQALPPRVPPKSFRVQMRRDTPPPRLYHASSIEEGHEDFDSETDNEEGLSRMSSYNLGAHGLSGNLPIAADKSVPIRPGPIGGLQGWDSDVLDLPVGEGGPTNRRKTCILSLDGGGMRGLIAARILSRLEIIIQEKVGGDKVRLCDYFDLLAGTSTGAILTTMLTTPDEHGEPIFTAAGCCQFYSQYGRHIFHSRWLDPLHGSLRQFYRPKYSPRRFENLLKHYLVRDGRELTLLDTLKPLLVTSFDISEATPFFFVRQAALKDPSRNFRLWEVCRATAAAPTYFPPAVVSSVDGQVTGILIDGGAIQNNPALVASTHVLSNNDEFPEANSLQDILILSLGAGQMDERHDLKKAKKWGMAGWVRPIMNIMMDGSADTVDYQLAAAYAGNNCAENYLRIQLSGLPNKTALMDCATKENISDLINCSDELLQQKAVIRNSYGEKVTLEETHLERLGWFADQLILQKKLREEGPKDPTFSDHALPPYFKEGLGPASRLVSPLFAHMFEHHNVFGENNKARSFRF